MDKGTVLNYTFLKCNKASSILQVQGNRPQWEFPWMSLKGLSLDEVQNLGGEKLSKDYIYVGEWNHEQR